LADGTPATEFTVTTDEVNHIYTIELNYVRGGGGGGGGGGGTPVPVEPVTDIEDEDPPLTDMVLPPDDEEVIIIDEDTPRTDLPQTGATLPAGGQSGTAQGAGGASAILPSPGRKETDNRGATV
jgi:hypothetical protein